MTAASCLMALNPIVMLLFFSPVLAERVHVSAAPTWCLAGRSAHHPLKLKNNNPLPSPRPNQELLSDAVRRRRSRTKDVCGRDLASLVYVQGWRILHANDSHRRPRKEEDRMTSFSFPPSGVLMSTSFLGPIVSAHPLRCIPWNFTVTRDNDAMTDRRNAHRRQWTAIATKRGLLYSPQWFAVPKRTTSEKADDPFHTLETGLKHLSNESRDSLELGSPSCVYCKVGFQVSTHVIIFHDCFVYPVHFFFICKD